MKELKNTIIGLLCNKSFLKDYICTIAVRSARRTVLRMYAKKPTAVGYISPATDDCEQIRMFLDKYLKLDAAESVKTTANTFMGDVPYANIEVDQDLQKAFLRLEHISKSFAKIGKRRIVQGTAKSGLSTLEITQKRLKVHPILWSSHWPNQK